MGTKLDAATIAKAARGEDAPPWSTGGAEDSGASLQERYGGLSGGSAIALYDPRHPSVLFDKLKRGLGGSRLIKAIGGWLGKQDQPEERAKHSRIIGKEGGRRLLESGLVIPSQRDVFLLSRPHDAADYLIHSDTFSQGPQQLLLKADQ